MRLLYKTNKFAIYDDVLTPEEFAYIYAYIQEEHYASAQNGNWIKVWRIGDCSPMGSRAYFHSQKPFNLPLDTLADRIDEAGKNHPEIIRAYHDVTYRSYLYPRGTKLSWHDDSQVYCGAATYYCHKKWGSTWGGELCVAEVPPLGQVFKSSPNKPHIDHEWEDNYVNIIGMGHFINPKPNRLVLMAPGVYHSINRVDVDAGDHPRCSIVGFFLPEKPVNSAEYHIDEAKGGKPPPTPTGMM
jgi:hypothetical protein